MLRARQGESSCAAWWGSQKVALWHKVGDDLMAKSWGEGESELRIGRDGE